jgi:hypothetical protein
MSNHNLNISMYSLEEILGLFDLTYDIDLDGIKRAKKKVLMLHPDKSRLSSDYFIFYKHAFEIIVRYYEEQTRHNRKTSSESTIYSQINETDKNVKRTINEIKPKDFHKKFNELFEKNASVKPDSGRNDWFKNDEPLYNNLENVSVHNMGRAFDNIKSVVVRNTDIQTLGGGGTSLYDDDTDDSYVTCDPFSKLKFDDLRKVHKDHTVLAISERDYESVKKYSSMDHLIQERGRDKLTPMEKNDSEKMMDTRQKEREHNIMRKQHAATIQAMENEKKGRVMLGNFLRLGN